MKLIFLGTSCMVPTKERNQVCTLLSHGSELLMFDCGEGTQRQFKIAGLKPTKVTKILISHWHGDHVLGLPGLIQTMSASEYSGTLMIFGPKGIKEKINGMMNVFNFDCNIRIDVREIGEGVFFENKDYILEAVRLRHRILCIGYRFIEKDKRRINLEYTKKLGIPEGPILGKLQRGQQVKWNGNDVEIENATKLVKGKKIAFIFDTIPCESCQHIAEDADVLVSEGVYCSDLEEKALEYKHLTAKQAAQIAKQANVKKLILTHLSQRYKETKHLKEEAEREFGNVVCADDFMEVKI
ncbi:ribonuclease Z [Candidatus Woesearchaeota archaeon]|nr:ribonuclease Z [Candidatus Woesearchaeota archaeon]